MCSTCQRLAGYAVAVRLRVVRYEVPALDTQVFSGL
jgi:hypothetical protein